MWFGFLRVFETFQDTARGCRTNRQPRDVFLLERVPPYPLCYPTAHGIFRIFRFKLFRLERAVPSWDAVTVRYAMLPQFYHIAASVNVV
jgi:hypothetical protein